MEFSCRVRKSRIKVLADGGAWWGLVPLRHKAFFLFLHLVAENEGGISPVRWHYHPDELHLHELSISQRSHLLLPLYRGLRFWYRNWVGGDAQVIVSWQGLKLLNLKQCSVLTHPASDKCCVTETTCNLCNTWIMEPSLGFCQRLSVHKILTHTGRRLTADLIRELTSRFRGGQQGGKARGQSWRCC